MLRETKESTLVLGGSYQIKEETVTSDITVVVLKAKHFKGKVRLGVQSQASKARYFPVSTLKARRF